MNINTLITKYKAEIIEIQDHIAFNANINVDDANGMHLIAANNAGLSLAIRKINGFISDLESMECDIKSATGTLTEQLAFLQFWQHWDRLASTKNILPRMVPFARPLAASHCNWRLIPSLSGAI